MKRKFRPFLKLLHILGAHSRSRIHYWGHSKKLRAFLRMDKTPYALGLEEWGVYHEEQHEKYPIRDWFMETFMSNLQDVCMFPSDVWHSLRGYIRNRFTSKTNSLFSNHLEKGQWYEMETRLLFCCFDTFQWFVENDMTHGSTTPEEHWAWEIELKNEETGELTSQALKGIEVRELYHWWLERQKLGVYVNFHDESAKELTEEELQLYTSFAAQASFFGKSPDGWDEVWKKICTREFELEAAQEQEDTDMLVRLMKLRRSLWS